MTFNIFKTEFLPASNILSPQGMAVAVHCMNEDRIRKGKSPINCFVLTNSLNADSPNELDVFLAQLNQLKDSIPDGTRFQILYHDYRTADLKHWVAIDVQVNNNQLDFLILDAANDLPHVLRVVTLIGENCPDANMMYAGGSIQCDRYNCAYFALDHAIAMAEIDNLHEDLSNYITIGKIGGYDNYAHYIEEMFKTHPEIILEGMVKEDAINQVKKLNYIKISDFPPILGSLLRNMQTLSFFENAFKGKGYLNGDQPLDEFIEAHTSDHNTNPYQPPLFRNDAIKHKKAEIKKLVIQASESLSEHMFEKIEQNSKNIDLLAPQLTENPATSPIEQTKRDNSVSSNLLMGLFVGGTALTGLGLVAAGITIAAIYATLWPVSLVASGTVALGVAGFFAYKAIQNDNSADLNLEPLSI